MKIMLYNIDHGGREGRDLRARWFKLLKVIKKVNPDIIIILEAWGWRQTKELRDFSQQAGFKYYSLSQSNTKHHLAVMSKIKPEKINKYQSGFHHSVLAVKFKDPISFTILGIHLSPKTESIRLREIKNIIKLAQQHQPVIMLGDFNSLSPQDNYDNKRLLAIFQKNKIFKFGRDKLETRVIREILAAGLIDITKKYYSGKTIQYSVPTKICTDSEHLTKLRLDYAFISRSLVPLVKKSSFIKSQLTHHSSDHFPLVLEIF